MRRFPDRLTAILTLTVASALTTRPACAQSAQKYAWQMSVLSTSIDVGTGGSATGGIGIEPQLRVNMLWQSEALGSVSLGVGGQWSRHTVGPDELTISGVFAEPRFIWHKPIAGIHPYAAGRLALLQQSSNFGTSSWGTAVGAGGGLAYPVTTRVNLDAGVALIRQRFGTFRLNNNSETSFRAFNTYAAKIGVSIGFGRWRYAVPDNIGESDLGPLAPR